MKKYSLVFALLTAFILVVSGCAVKNANDTKAVNSADNNNRWGDTASGTMRMNFGTPATKADLAIGKKVSVFGTSNADGTVNATQIVIGEMPMFGRGFASGTPFNASGTPPMPRDASQAPEGDNFQPPPSGDMPQGQTGGQAGFQRPAQMDGSGQRRMRAAGGQSRISGEIMKLDDVSIVLKIVDNGSKIVFYSDATEIFLAPTSTPNFSSTTVK
jgi:hypothetical protein